ncbi:MAG: DUF6659 family protein [Nitrosopumilaceae archaeon]|nr:DUF6659 family protein [Nitrosopumilaceae archaeon]
MTEEIEQKLSDILKDGEVRFAGLIDKHGNLVKGDFRKGLIPFENDEEQKQSFQELAVRVSTRKKFDHSMGPVKYSASRREKLVMMSFPLDNNILMITADPHVNIDRLAYKIIQKLGNTWSDFWGK